jgi:DNA uptake protein ComE-like DNA-binding protein
MLSLLLYRLRQYAGFSQREAYAVPVLLLLIISSWILPFLIHRYWATPQDEQAAKASHTAFITASTLAKAIAAHTATLEELQQIAGIGPARAGKLVQYRRQLGGFVHTGQYAELGFPSEVVTALQAQLTITEDFTPRKINVNVATKPLLAAHPYISYYQAKIIVAYVAQHGPLQDVERLGELHGISEEEMARMLPYLSAS